ncbi:MAG: hypothetical protein ACJ8DZ_13895 [Allosphingosinicella sp.]
MGDLLSGSAGQAHARRRDPDTSHQAADSVTPELRQMQVRVAEFAKGRGVSGFTDAEMSSVLKDDGSTYRTRRSELTARNIIIDSGERRAWGDSSRMRIVWRHRDYVKNPPPVCDPPKPATDEDRADGRDMAIKLAGYAASMKKEGRAMFSEELAEAAAIMRRLSA